MKKLTVVLAVVLIIAGLSSCETDFDVTAEWKDIPVVYGLLDQNDSVHYVKVNKAFLGDGNLLEYAQNQDSSLYDDIKVIMEEIDDGELRRAIQMDTATIHNKDSGAFFYPDQILYTTGTENAIYLNKNYSYRLKVIDKPTNNVKASASTNLVHGMVLTQPRITPNMEVHFPDYGTKSVEWLSAVNGTRYQVKIYFNYEERMKNGNTVRRTLTWNPFEVQQIKDTTGGKEMKTAFENEAYYDFIAENVPYEDTDKEEQVNLRVAKNFTFEVSVASQVFDKYMEIYQPSESIVQYRPEYTNISNGIGLFSSRTAVSRTFAPQKPTRGYLSDLGVKFQDTNQ